MESTARGLAAALSRLRDIHPDMTVLQAQMLFVIACHEGLSQRECYSLVGTNDSTASRVLAILSDIGGRSVAPMHLVAVRVNPEDRRERVLSLTRKGNNLLKDIQRDLTGGAHAYS